MTNKVNNRDNWHFEKDKFSLLDDKSTLKYYYISYMLNRVLNMFEYGDLPNDIPQRDLDKILFTYGYAVIKKVKGKMYAFYGGLGGVPNAYYLPTLAVVANPYLKYSDVLEIDKDCVVIRNDSMYNGLLPLMDKYATLITECDLSLRIATINTRIPVILSANDDVTMASAKEFVKKMIDGDISIIGTNDFLTDSLKTFDYSNKQTSNVKDLVELRQYLVASWYNELGLNANYNMKRESLNETEIGIDEDTLLPLIDDMLKNRKQGIEKVNAMFGTKITVKLSSSWQKIRKELAQEQKQNEVDETSNEDAPKVKESDGGENEKSN